MLHFGLRFLSVVKQAATGGGTAKPNLMFRLLFAKQAWLASCAGVQRPHCRRRFCRGCVRGLIEYFGLRGRGALSRLRCARLCEVRALHVVLVGLVEMIKRESTTLRNNAGTLENVL